MSDLEDIKNAALHAVENSSHAASLEEERVKYLGKKGELTRLLKELGTLSPEERPEAGAAINSAKKVLQSAISKRKAFLEDFGFGGKRELFLEDHGCDEKRTAFLEQHCFSVHVSSC